MKEERNEGRRGGIGRREEKEGWVKEERNWREREDKIRKRGKG